MDAVYTGNRISALRKEKGWTQKELAEQLHVTDKAVSKWERGLNFPELSLLEPLAATLGVTVADLLGLEDTSGGQMLAAAMELHQREKDRLAQAMTRYAKAVILLVVIQIFAFAWLGHAVGTSAQDLAHFLLIVPTGLLIFLSRSMFLGYWPQTLRTK